MKCGKPGIVEICRKKCGQMKKVGCNELRLDLHGIQGIDDPFLKAQYEALCMLE